MTSKYQGISYWVQALIILLCLVKPLLASIPGNADYLKQIADGNQAYTDGNYAAAVKIYTLVLANGNELPEVHYNLGNAYFRINNVPRAILHYERAKRGLRYDEDISYNLELANLQIVDKEESSPESIHGQGWNLLANYFSLQGWTILSLVAFWIFTTCIYVYFISGIVQIKRASFYSGLLFLGITLFSIAFANTLHKAANHENTAIVFSASVTVKSVPGEHGMDLFILHPGFKVQIVEKVGSWNKIRLSNGAIGWLRDSTIEII